MRLNRIEIGMLIAFAFACITIAAPASAEERCVDPADPDYTSLGFPKLCYEYHPGGVVWLTTSLRAGFPIEEITTDVTFPDGSYAKIEKKSEVYVEDESENFTPAGEVKRSFDNRVFLGEVKKPGRHDVSVHYLTFSYFGEEREASAFFGLDLPTFDFEEAVCILNKRVMVLEFNLFTMGEVPASVALNIEYDGTEILSLQRVRVRKYGNFGAIELPMPRMLYRRGFENKKMQVTVTLNGEEVVRHVHLPHRVNARSTCMRG